ncbi:hypothetical protein PGT21_004613 [Puccinia graminis f. sp. tritici]|uniref:RRM domain-containing protein n=1 Tax=Puccinia graminis f. sp. tritici TaxID=56615 RepID=A0A5B0NIG4_PUCGR|nr:hypothetical protein PGT21_004613 [Puccinia graminis f. sp. tritici]
MQPPLFPFEHANIANECNSIGSAAGSSLEGSSPETDPFCISSPEHSRVSSDNGAVEGASPLKSFDPFSDPLFYLPFRPRGGGSEHAKRFSSMLEHRQRRLGENDERQTDWMTPSVNYRSAEPISRIPSMDADAIPPPTNVFVANFPSHWSKSDLWDLFEGIPVTTRAPGEESVYGGTGFVNITRASDAHALLAMLDKKIWLIDGSALKFRLANSSPPTEPANFQVPKKNRTVRRHQHKVIDRLRAEQTVGNKQLACCDRHQIVVYQNISPKKTATPTLSVVHGSRQRNTQFVCNATETSLATSVAQRPFLEYLKTYLNRRNRYNSQQIVVSSLKPNAANVLSPPALQQVVSSPPNQATSVIKRPDLNPYTSVHSGNCFRTAGIAPGLDALPQGVACPPSTSYYSWASDVHSNMLMYNQASRPSLSVRWIPAPHAVHPQPHFSQLFQGHETSPVFLAPFL